MARAKKTSAEIAAALSAGEVSVSEATVQRDLQRLRKQSRKSRRGKSK